MGLKPQLASGREKKSKDDSESDVFLLERVTSSLKDLGLRAASSLFSSAAGEGEHTSIPSDKLPPFSEVSVDVPGVENVKGVGDAGETWSHLLELETGNAEYDKYMESEQHDKNRTKLQERVQFNYLEADMAGAFERNTEGEYTSKTEKDSAKYVFKTKKNEKKKNLHVPVKRLDISEMHVPAKQQNRKMHVPMETLDVKIHVPGKPTKIYTPVKKKKVNAAVKQKKKQHADPGARYIAKQYELGKTAPRRSPRYGDERAFAVQVYKHQRHNTHFRKTRFAQDWEHTVQLVAEQSKTLSEYVNLDRISGHTWTAFVREEKHLDNSIKPLWSIRQVDSELVYTSKQTKIEFKDFPNEMPLAERWEECKRKNGTTFYRNVLDKYFAKRRNTMSRGAFLPETESCIKKVVFHLHRTYPKNQIVVDTNPFAVTRIGWGTFDVGMQVYFFDHYTPNKIFLNHDLDFNNAEVNKLVEVSLLDTRTGEEVTVTIRFGNAHTLVETRANKGDATAAKLIKARKDREELLKKQMEFGLDLRRASDDMEAFIELSENKRMALGSIMAVALDSHIFDTKNFSVVYSQAKPNLRYVVLDEETLRNGFQQLLLTRNLNDEGNRGYVQNISQRCKDGEFIDRFVSHSWLDSPEAKFDALMKFSKRFEEENGRLPRLWIDMFCIDQDPSKIQVAIKCLPVYLMTCDKILCLGSPNILNRMWCLTEIYTAWIMSSQEDDPSRLIEWIDVGPENMKTKVSRGMISLRDARCSKKLDEDALRAKLRRCPGGIPRVEDAIYFAVTSADKLQM